MKREPYGLVLSMESHTPVCEPEKTSEAQAEQYKREGDEILDQVTTALQVKSRMDEAIEITRIASKEGGLSAAGAKALAVSTENFFVDLGVNTQGLVPSEKAFIADPQEATDIAIEGMSDVMGRVKESLSKAWNAVAERTNAILYVVFKNADMAEKEIAATRRKVDASTMEKVEAFQSPDIAKALVVNGKVPDDVAKAILLHVGLLKTYVAYTENYKKQMEALEASLARTELVGDVEYLKFTMPEAPGLKKVGADQVASLVKKLEAEDDKEVHFLKSEVAPGQVYLGAIMPNDSDIFGVDHVIYAYGWEAGLNHVQGDQNAGDGSMSTVTKRQALELLNKCEELTKYIKSTYNPQFDAASRLRLQNKFSRIAAYEGKGDDLVYGISMNYSNILWRASDVSKAALQSVSAVIDLVKKSID